MMEFHTILMIVVHYGYDAVVEFVVEIGDHFVTHYVLVLVLKAGVVHVGWVTVMHFHRKRTATPKDVAPTTTTQETKE